MNEKLVTSLSTELYLINVYKLHLQYYTFKELNSPCNIHICCYVQNTYKGDYVGGINQVRKNCHLTKVALVEINTNRPRPQSGIEHV